MKGFIKIFESIIASIIILASLTFFFNIEVRQTEWGDTSLQIRGGDILASLVESGVLTQAVDTNNQSLLNETFLTQSLSLIPATMDYSVEIRGLPNPVIFIGCNCSAENITSLRDTLGPHDFSYHGRNISIRIVPSPIDDIRSEANVLFLYNYTNLNAFRPKLEKFLNGGGTIFMYGDMSQAQLEDGILNELFGLSWNAGGVRPATGIFNNADNENLTSFRILKYYGNLTGGTPDFGFVGTAKVSVDSRTIISNGGHSMVKINEGVVGGRGRTVWMSNISASSATNNLTKAVVMWASGERFLMNRAKTFPPKHFETTYIVRDKDVYIAVLTLWRAF